MFLKVSGSHGRKFLSFVQGYRGEDGKIKHRTIESLGFLDDLEKKYDDPISHFKNIAKIKTKEEIKEFTIKNINTKLIDKGEFNTKNLGYSILKKIYYELTLNDLLDSKQKTLNINYSLNSIFELLIYSRILYPGSKKETYNNKEIFFEKFDFSLKDLYHSLDYISQYKDDIEKLLWNKTKEKYKRDTSKTYYDCTNYYFEIPYNDEDLIDEEGNILEKGYRKKGVSKEHRKSPIIQMGLLMDNNGIPLAYDLFSGNESEKTQLRPTLKKSKTKFEIERTIVVADRGLNTSDNTVFIAYKNDDSKINHDGYVYGQSILGASEEFKKYVLDQSDYKIDYVEDNGKNISFKHKSRVIAKDVAVERNGARNTRYQIYQKQMIYFSQKYADRQQKMRELAIAKATDLINKPYKYNKATSHGVTSYINNIKFVKSTGEIPGGLELSLNTKKIEEEQKYDGYYSIVTSEKDLADIEIRNIYKGLWEIEETFKITKSNLETRPVYVWTPEHIEAHFLTCFVSLVILRLLEKETKEKYSINQLINSIRKYTSSNVEHNLYIQTFNNEIIQELQSIFNIDLSKKYLLLSEIKKIIK